MPSTQLSREVQTMPSRRAARVAKVAWPFVVLTLVDQDAMGLPGLRRMPHFARVLALALAIVAGVRRRQLRRLLADEDSPASDAGSSPSSRDAARVGMRNSKKVGRAAKVAWPFVVLVLMDPDALGLPGLRRVPHLTRVLGLVLAVTAGVQRRKHNSELRVGFLSYSTIVTVGIAAAALSAVPAMDFGAGRGDENAMRAYKRAGSMPHVRGTAHRRSEHVDF